MALRKPPAGLDPAWPLPTQASGALTWQHYRCQLVTPLYGGGVQAGKVDPAMPIRASAIRGQLRFWWRLLARHKWKLGNTDAIRQAEFALWGGVGSEALASKVHVRIPEFSRLDVSLPPKVSYAVFSTIGEEEPGMLARPGLSWRLGLGIDVKCSTDQQSQLEECLRWWSAFGGVGARTRRGLGAISIENINAPTADECKEAGCTLVLLATGSKSAEAAQSQAVGKLKQFRQGENIGRNPKSAGKNTPGRSRWPEPDAIRILTNTHAHHHAPEHKAAVSSPRLAFPRAAFGLPIGFRFTGPQSGGGREPGFFSLLPQAADRLASPLILRPVRQGDKWHAAALLLPTDHLKTMRLKLPDGSVTDPGAWWDPAKAELVPPLKGRGDDALSAFLNYFAKS